MGRSTIEQKDISAIEPADVKLDTEYWNDGSLRAIKAEVLLADGRSAIGYSHSGNGRPTKETAIRLALEKLSD
jgi:hypothetical protein